MGRVLFLLSCLAPLVACTIEREFPPGAFACSAGGPCPRPDAAEVADTGARRDALVFDDAAAPDAIAVGEDAALDAGVADADPPDRGPLGDVGVADPTCAPATPVPSSGVIMDDNLMSPNTHQGFCAQSMGGRDDTYFFISTSSIASLTVSTANSALDTVLYMYDGDCRRGSEIDCSDDLENGEVTSLLERTNVPAGAHYVTVDGFDAAAVDAYVLTVSGVLPPGARCDPNQAFLACPRGVCFAGANGVRRCREGIDCADPFDTDGVPGQVACVNPPMASCPMGMSVAGLFPLDLTAMATDDGLVAGRQWVTASTHATPPVLTNAFTDRVTVAPREAGPHRFWYQATDDDLQTRACETSVDFRPDSFLHVELSWVSADRAFDFDLHLLDPAATMWGDGVLDCDPDFCVPFLPWGGPGAADDPRFFNVASGPPGGERVEIRTPQNGTFSVGTNLPGDPGMRSGTARIRVYCGGNLVFEQSATLPDMSGHDFWHAADIAISGGTCTVTPRLGMGGGPLLRYWGDALSER